MALSPLPRRTKTAALVVAAACAPLAGCGAPVLTPGGPVGEGELKILFDSLALMLTIVVPTIAATLLFAWWFRASNSRAKRLPDWAYSGRVELLVWTAPLLTVAFLGGMTWIASHRLDPYAPLPSKQKPLEVQVVSLDWKWLFIYPEEGVATVNALVAPAGRPVHFSLTSASVMTAFFVPRLGSMIYTMNGMATQLSLQADQPGVYPGLASHFSGDGFPGMHFDLRATSPADYAAWIAAARANGPVLDKAAYEALAKQSSDVAPYSYRDVAPGLFHDIVMQTIAPAPGPRPDKPHARVFPKPLEKG